MYHQYVRRDWEERDDGSSFLSNTDRIDDELEQALEALEHGRISDIQKARYFLREALDEETEYIEVNGHLFEDEDVERCADPGCDLRCNAEFIRDIAKRVDCPSPYETVEHKIESERRKRGEPQ